MHDNMMGRWKRSQQGFYEKRDKERASHGHLTPGRVMDEGLGFDAREFNPYNHSGKGQKKTGEGACHRYVEKGFSVRKRALDFNKGTEGPDKRMG